MLVFSSKKAPITFAKEAFYGHLFGFSRFGYKRPTTICAAADFQLIFFVKRGWPHLPSTTRAKNAPQAPSNI